jgi:hypothetical protein
MDHSEEVRADPYVTGGQPVLRPSLVCFADILGYKSLSVEALRAGNGPQFLQRIHSALSEAHTRVHRHAEGLGEARFFAVSVFTDSIVVGYPLTSLDWDDGEPETVDMFGTFAEFQASLAMQGFLLRGGIACGDHYMDKDVVFGDALLEAVALDRAGGPPRLALANSTIQLVDRHLRSYGAVQHSPHYSDLLMDADGTPFLNYLAEAFIAFPAAGPFFEVFDDHGKTVRHGLEVYRSKPDVRAKYEWAARYHNYVCRDFAERHPIPTSEDADPEYAAAAEQAQGLLSRLVDIESFAAEPAPISRTLSEA